MRETRNFMARSCHRRSILEPAPAVWGYPTYFNVLYYIEICEALVSYEEFLSELSHAGLTVREFADLVGKNPNSISNYARLGELPDHLAIIAVLIAEMSARGLDFRCAIGRVDLTWKKPRGGARAGHFGGDRQVPLDLDV